MENVVGTSGSNKKKVIIIAATIALAIAAIVTVFIVFGSKGSKLKRCINLGQKYLSEMNYEEAIACFENALEIEPMSADAYLGIADAYIGMASTCAESGDYEGAYEALDFAKEKLERGIELLTKYAEANTGRKADDAKSDIERLQEKLEEIAEIENSYLPNVHIEPLMEGLNNVWGRNWKEWTLEDYIAAYNLVQYNIESNELTDKPTPVNGRVRCARPDHDGAVLLEDVYSYQYNSNHYMWYADDRIYIFNDYFRYEKILSSTNHEVTTDGIYSFCMSNGITSPEAAAEFFGLSNLNDGESVKIITEYGLAYAQYFTDNPYGSTFAIFGFKNDEKMRIEFGYTAFEEAGSLEFEASVTQSK